MTIGRAKRRDQAVKPQHRASLATMLHLGANLALSYNPAPL